MINNDTTSNRSKTNNSNDNIIIDNASDNSMQ